MSVYGHFQEVIIPHVPAIVNGMKYRDHINDLSKYSQKFFSVLDTGREMMRIMMTKTNGKAARMAPVCRPLSPPDYMKMLPVHLMGSNRF